MREILSNKYINGSGIEIGALHNPLKVPPSTHVTYVDIEPINKLKQLHSQAKELDIILDNAETLEHIESSSQNFVIANHVLEHCENVILTIENWLRVLKPQGVIFCALPLKDQCFDRNRQCTTFEHLCEEYVLGTDIYKKQHYYDWYANSELELKKDEALHNAVDTAMKNNQNVHFHVWDEFRQGQLFYKLSQRPNHKFDIIEYVINGSEMIWILQKI